MKFNDLDLSILKNILSNKRTALEFSAECGESVFTPELFRFAKHVNDYIKIYKDVPTRRTLIDSFAKNDASSKYIGEVFDVIDTVTVIEKEYKHDLKCIKDRYAEQLLVSLKESVFSDDKLNGEIPKNVQAIQQTLERVKGLYKNKVYDQKTLKQSTQEFKNRYLAKTRDPNFGRGIFTGYSFLDYQTNGLRPAELFLVAGESGSGKSMMLMNMAIQMWLQQNKVMTPVDEYKKGYNVLYFSLEMPYEQCLNRVVSRVSEVAYRGIRDGNLPVSETEKLSGSLKFINNYPYEFEIVDIPRGASIENLELIFIDAKLRFQPDIVVIDYLGLMDYDGPEADDWLKLGKISEQLHEFARVYNVCVLSAVQLNRMAKAKGSTEEDKIGAHRIGRSALIIQNANVAMQIEKRAEEHMHPDMIVHLIKNRDGELVKGRLLKNFSCCALTNDYGIEGEEVVNSDDISEKLKKLEGL